MSQSSTQDILPAKIFHDQMIAYLDEYADYLLVTKSDPTVISKRVILQQFINYLFNEYLVTCLEGITPEMLHFGNLSNEEYPDLTSTAPPGLILGTLKDFFEFLYGKYGLKKDVLSQWLDQLDVSNK